MAASPNSPDLRGVSSPPLASPGDRELWRQFSEAITLHEAVSHWLALIRTRLTGMRAASVFHIDPVSGAVDTFATWPIGDGDEVARAASAVEALSQRVPLILSAAHGFHLAYAIDALQPWVIVIEVTVQPVQGLQRNLEELRWGSGWLLARLAHTEVGTVRARAQVLELAARLAENVARETDASRATHALASGLAVVFETRCVTVGVLRRRELILTARQRDDGRHHINDDGAVEIAEVMNAALASARTLVVAPVNPQSEIAQDNAFDLLAAQGAACVLPLLCEQKKVGAVLLERAHGRPFLPEEIETLEALAAQVAPLIDAKPLNARAPVTKERRALVRIFGGRRIKLKLALIACLLLGIVMLGATTDYRVRADVVVEGGPIKEVRVPEPSPAVELLVKRGDVVRKGQALAKIDDHEAREERDRLIGVRSQLEQVLREAKDIRDRGATESLEPKLKDVNATLAELELRLARAAIVSPADGVVIGGRAFEKRGAALKPADVAFMISPIEGYRLVLWVEEHELAALREGQDGMAYFAEIPSEILFTVKRITGVTQRKDGSQSVRVEAQLQTLSDLTRPGMTGSATIDAGHKKWVWVWWQKAQRLLGRPS